MYAYVDESGNTGGNLFDPVQPYFFNAAMSSPVDFDEVFRERVSRIARSINVQYLHASEIGTTGVESIAGSLIDLIEFSQARFHFGYVAKSDLAITKFYDAIFDPGENPAASQHSYGIRFLRLLLLIKFASILEISQVKLFWQAITSVRSTQSESMAIEAIGMVLERVDLLPDARSRQLITDTLCWARDNIGEFSFWSSNKQELHVHLPNIFLLHGLVNAIHKSAKLWDDKVEMIIHDQQSQFEGSLLEWHSFYKTLDPEPIYHLGDMQIQFADIRDSQFETRDSKLSPGLQVVDVVLWTFSRIMSGKQLGQTSSELFKLCFSYDDFVYISIELLIEEIEAMAIEVMNKPLSESQLEEGRKLMKRRELMRQDRLRSSSRPPLRSP